MWSGGRAVPSQGTPADIPPLQRMPACGYNRALEVDAGQDAAIAQQVPLHFQHEGAFEGVSGERLLLGSFPTLFSHLVSVVQPGDRRMPAVNRQLMSYKPSESWFKTPRRTYRRTLGQLPQLSRPAQKGRHSQRTPVYVLFPLILLPTLLRVFCVLLRRAFLPRYAW